MVPWDAGHETVSSKHHGMLRMVYRFARFVQFCGLMIMPLGIVGNVSNRLSLRDSLTIAAIGMGVFAFGWLLQQNSKGPS